MRALDEHSMILRNIQAMRGLAALLIVTIHAIQSVNAMYVWNKADAGYLPSVVPHLTALGLIGVDLFFVISGFVLFLAAHRVGERGKGTHRASAAVRFAMNRALRIYPLYWIVFLVTAASTEIITPGTLAEALTKVREIFLVKWDLNYTVVGPAWTLSYEIYFYAWMSLAVYLAPRRLEWGVALWLGAHGFMIAASRAGLMPDLGVATDPILMDFGAGAVIAMLFRSGSVGRSWIPVCAAAILLAAGLWALSLQTEPGPMDRLPRLLTFGAFSICVIYVAIGFELRGRIAARPWRGVGDASYSIYLWHGTVFWTLNWVGTSLGLYTYGHPYLTVAIWFVIALPIGLISYRWFEQPLLRLIRLNRPVRGLSQPA